LRRTALLLSLLLLMTGYCWAPARGAELRILVEDDAEPFSRKDGNGYANDIVKAAFDAVGVQVQFQVVPYARCKAAVLAGTEAACFSMSRSETLAGLVKFSNAPLFSVTPIYFQNRDHRLAARSEAELGNGAVVGIVNGYEYPESALKAQARGARFEPARTEQINLKKLALHRIDTALVMENSLRGAEFWVRDAGVSGQVIPTFHSTSLDSFIGFSTRHPQGMTALDQFNRGFALIQANGTARKIFEKWSSNRAWSGS